MEPRRAPDLLFEEERDARVLEIAPLLAHPERLGPETPLHRLTVFLTYRCNLACPYCKTIARDEAELALALARSVVSRGASTTCRSTAPCSARP